MFPSFNHTFVASCCSVQMHSQTKLMFYAFFITFSHPGNNEPNICLLLMREHMAIRWLKRWLTLRLHKFSISQASPLKIPFIHPSQSCHNFIISQLDRRNILLDCVYGFVTGRSSLACENSRTNKECSHLRIEGNKKLNWKKEKRAGKKKQWNARFRQGKNQYLKNNTQASRSHQEEDGLKSTEWVRENATNEEENKIAKKLNSSAMWLVPRLKIKHSSKRKM